MSQHVPLSKASREPVWPLPQDYASLHELGHAVVAAELGAQVHYVSIETDPRPETMFSPTELTADEDIPVIGLGGAAATFLVYGTTYLSSVDIAVSRQQCAGLHMDIEKAWKQACKIVQANEEAIREAAPVLVESGTLDAGELYYVTTGEMPPPEVLETAMRPESTTPWTFG